MDVQFINDDQGKPAFAVIPIAMWRDMQAHVAEAEALSPEDEADRAEAFAELERGEALELQEAMDQW